MSTAWTWHGAYYDVPPQATNGSASTITDQPKVVTVKHVLGFARPNWGEANWTAKDMR